MTGVVLGVLKTANNWQGKFDNTCMWMFLGDTDSEHIWKDRVRKPIMYSNIALLAILQIPNNWQGGRELI